MTRGQELVGNHFSKNKRVSNQEMLRWIEELREGVPICVVETLICPEGCKEVAEVLVEWLQCCSAVGLRGPQRCCGR